jgi:uncharacterized protein YraI
MANDFDNDDLSWLRDQDPNQDDDSSDDDLPDFDWLLDDADKSSSGSGKSSTGLTGQLPWQQGDSDRDNASTGDNSARLGVTGELDWRKARNQPDFESMFDGLDQPEEWSTSTPDWDTPEEVFGDAAKPVVPPTSADVDDDEVPDWLQGMLEDVDDEPAAPSPAGDAQRASFFDFGPTDELDLSLTDEVEELDEPEALTFETEEDELPDWLLSAAPAAPVTADTADEEDDGLSGLFDDMSFDDADDNEVDLDFDDVPAPVAYGTGATEPDIEDEDDDLFGSLLTDDDVDEEEIEFEDEVAPTANFTPSSGLDFEDYSLLEALDAPSESGTGETVSDDFFSSLLDDVEEDEDEPVFDARQEFSFDDAPAVPTLERFSPDFSADDDSLQWMTDLETLDDLSQAPTRETEIDSVDDFLASLGSFDSPAPVSTPDVDSDLMIAGDDIDFNRLLSDPAFADFETEVEDSRSSFERPMPAPDSPEWLADVRIQEVSASALVRQQQDRPVEELPSRLQALRQKGLDLPTVDASDSGAVPVFTPTEANTAVPQAQTGQITLTPEQARRVELLRSVTHSDVQPVETRPQRTSNVRSRIARIAASLLIAAAVLIPFVTSIRIGNLPPSSFAVGSSQDAVFAAVDDLGPRDLVLFAAEYGGTNAGELDGLADVLLRHTILKGAVPVVVSTNPIGLLRMDRNLSQIANGQLRRDRDYYIGHYIPGDEIGLRSLPQEIGRLTSTDSNGRATNLNITSLNDFAAIVLITGEASSVRNWSEQIAPLTQAPLLFAVSSSVSPVAQPYADAAGASALLIGYRDSYTYADQLNALLDGGVVPPLIEFDTETPTPEPTETATEAPDATETPESGVIATEEADETDATAATAEETSTEAVATETPAENQAGETPTTEADITATEAEEAEATATSDVEEVEPSPAVSPTPDIDANDDSAGAIFGEVTSDEPINVRSGPGTDFAPVGVLQPGERFEVLGESDDGSWINVQLANDTRGWVFSQLVDVESPTSSLTSPQVAFGVINLGGIGVGNQGSPALLLQQSPVEQVATRTPRPTQTRRATPTEEATEDATEESTDEAAVVSGTSSGSDTPNDEFGLRVELPYREERWYGMTFGILVIVVVIVLGNIIGLLSRRSARPGQRDR